MTKKELLEMDLGACVSVNSSGPGSKGHLSEIHRVIGGWIYVFEHTRQGATNYAVGLSSTFVPEETGINPSRFGF